MVVQPIQKIVSYIFYVSSDTLISFKMRVRFSVDHVSNVLLFTHIWLSTPYIISSIDNSENYRPIPYCINTTNIACAVLLEIQQILRCTLIQDFELLP